MPSGQEGASMKRSSNNVAKLGESLASLGPTFPLIGHERRAEGACRNTFYEKSESANFWGFPYMESGSKLFRRSSPVC